MKYDTLFNPLSIGRMEIKNRFVMTAIDTGMAGFDGRPTELLTDYYLQRVRGGVGLIITGICRVNNNHGVAEPRQLSLVRDSAVPAFRKLTDSIHNEGGRVAVQLHHPGRQNYSALIGIWPMVEAFSRLPGFERVFPLIVRSFARIEEMIWAPAVAAPSVIPCNHVRQKTRSFRNREIKALVNDFIRAAGRAKKAGFDAVELHAAHGYLIQQFLSPYTNRRTDQYGGSFENRLRFIKEIIEGIRSICGNDYPLIVRLTVDEFDERGIDPALGVKIAKALETLGVDAIDVSSGSYEQTNKWLETVNYQAGWRKHLAAAVKQEVDIPVIAANLIRSAAQAAAQIEDGIQDFIGLGRPLLADPELPRKIREGREREINRCIVCCQCYESLLMNAWKGKPLRCSVNPVLNRIPEQPQPLPGGGRVEKAVVVGAGPGGLQAALKLRERGWRVVLFEKNFQPGGQVRLADKAPDKEKLGWIIDDLFEAVKKADVELRFGEEAAAETVRRETPDAVILATGAQPVFPAFPGADLDHVYSFDSVLSGRRFPAEAETVAVIGSGLTGLETAEYLLARGKRITIVEMASEPAPGAHFQHRDEALAALDHEDVRILTGMKLVKIMKGSIMLENPALEKLIQEKSDAVVLALGSRPYNPLESELSAGGFSVYVIGDAAGAGRIADAVEDGYLAAQI